ncbi:uncharacterized protein LOC144121113 [Amblyomma americanum]
MPKNSKSGRGKVSLLLCVVAFLTASVILALGIFSNTSRTKDLFGLGSDENPHRGRILLSVLKNWKLPGNASRQRTDELWGRLLEKVKKAVGHLGTSSTTTTIPTTSRSIRASKASRTSRSVATSTTAAAEYTSESDRFGDGETESVDHGRSEDYTTSGVANKSERLRRTPIANGRGISVTTPEDEIKAFFDHDDGIASNSSLRGITSDSDEAASSFKNSPEPTVAPGTDLAIASDENRTHQGTFQTDYSSPLRESHTSTTRSKKTRGLENNADEEVGEKPSLEARGRGGTRRSGSLENSSSGVTVGGSGVQGRKQVLVAAGTSYGRDDLNPREALDLVKAHVETGSAIFRDGVDWIEERIPAPSASEVVRESSNLSAAETGFPVELPRKGIASKGQRLFASGAGFSFSDGKERSPDIGPDSSAEVVQSNRNSTVQVLDIKANTRRSERLRGIDSFLFPGKKSGKAVSRTGISDRQALESFPTTTTEDEDEMTPRTKTADYEGNTKNVNGSLADARRSGYSETGSLPNIVHTNASDASVGSLSAESSSPVSNDELRSLARDSVSHPFLSTAGEMDTDAQPPHSQTYAPEVTADDVTGEAVDVSPGKIFVSEILARTKAASTDQATELGSSVASDSKGIRSESGGNSAKIATELNEGPLLELSATNSEPPVAWSPAVRTKGVRRYRMTDTADAGTEPFQEVAQTEDVTTLAANKEFSTAVPTPHSQRDNLDSSTTAATGFREAELFDLSRELDRIAHEFVDFLESKEKSYQGSSNGGQASTSAGPGKPLHADKDVETVSDSDGVPATSTAVVVKDLAVATTVQEYGGDSTSGDAGREEEESSKDLDEETRPNAEQTTSGLVTDVRTRSEGGQIYCSVGSAYTGPLPPALCSYFLVYSAVEYNSNRKSFQVAPKGSWRALVSKASRTRMGPRVLLVLSAGQVQNLVADFPVPAVFATKAKFFLEARGLWGLAFDLSLATDYDARSHAMLFRETKGSLPGYHFVGLMDFFAASGLLRANLAELVGSVHKVFLRHDPQRVYTIGTSVPNPFASPNRRSYSVENAMRLAESLRLVSPDHNQVCLSVSLAVYKFNIYTLDANYSSPGVGSLAFSVDTGFSYSELCKNYKGLHTHFDEASLSTYVHKGNAWLGFDDDTSMEIKIDKLSRGHRVGCLLADHIDLDDFKNVCKKGDFPRLRLLKRTFLSRERR